MNYFMIFSAIVSVVLGVVLAGSVYDTDLVLSLLTDYLANFWKIILVALFFFGAGYVFKNVSAKTSEYLLAIGWLFILSPLIYFSLGVKSDNPIAGLLVVVGVFVFLGSIAQMLGAYSINYINKSIPNNEVETQ